MKLRLFSLMLVLGAALGAAANDFLRALPQFSTVVPGYESPDSVERRMAAEPLCPLEGLWQMLDNGALFAIERAEFTPGLAPDRLRLVMVRSPWRSLRPGTVFGHAVPSAKPGVYEACIYSDFARHTCLGIARRFTLTLGADSRMVTFRPFKSPLKVNLFNLLPYMYRRVVTPQKSRPDDLDGAVKVFPAAAGHPLSPVYL